MCGIAGIVWSDPQRPVASALLTALTNQLTHRGPDGVGYYQQPGVGLGHRRLSIIDLVGGAQPLANEDETVWVTFNGEIYNYPELRDELLAKGHQFRTQSDTEVLVHLYEESGPEMFARLWGMFALAIWDQKHRRLLLARDRLGKKPLVYWLDQQGLRFASELKSLLADPAFPRTLDWEALDDYLTYQYVPFPATIFSAARKLPPAHFAIYEAGQLEVRRYWRPPIESETQISAADAGAELRELVTDATRRRMISDVPLGAFLSGGIDSSIIVGTMARLTSTPIKTFSIGFPIAEFDESKYAQMVAQKFGTDHHPFVVEPNVLESIERLAWHYDEPFADSSAVPTDAVSGLTRQQVTVALTGDAGDELFAGYERYQAVRLWERFDRLPKLVRKTLLARWWRALPTSGRQKSRWRQFRRFCELSALPPTDRYRNLVSIFHDGLRPSLYSTGIRAALAQRHPRWFLDEFFQDSGSRDFLTRTLYVDLCTYLPCDLLVKVDIASMAHGLECRSPFLDHRIVEFAARLPIHYKLHGSTKKWLLKQAFADILPPKIVQRRKMGFGVPLDHWFRRELRPMLQDMLGSERFRQRGWFHPPTIDRLIHEHLTGRWDHSSRLWSLLMLEWWARTHLDPPPAPLPEA